MASGDRNKSRINTRSCHTFSASNRFFYRLDSLIQIYNYSFSYSQGGCCAYTNDFYLVILTQFTYNCTYFSGTYIQTNYNICLLYTSDAADEEDSVDLGGRRIIKKKKQKH